MSDLREELADFFVLADFAISARRLDGSTFAGILLDPYQASQIGLAPVEATNPVLRCVEADTLDIIDGDFLTIAGIDYLVRERRPDGTGLIAMALEKSSGLAMWDDGNSQWDGGNTGWVAP